MSISLHSALKDRRYYGTKRKYKHEFSYDERIYSDKYIMSQMTLERELEGHTGCINTLDWSLGGDKLLSGSDDTKLNIYYPFEDYRLAESISTGHHANIFTAKFMPQTSDNIIISGAGDSEIRIFDLNDSGSLIDAMYVCHSDQVKKICVYDDNPFEFLTCSQDGTVRHFDIRIPHVCTPHNVRSFITAQSRPAKQNPIPQGRNVRYGCSSPIVNYSKYNIELNSMTINKIFPYYFAVAGLNDYIYLHDRRMLPSQNQQVKPSSSSSTASQMMDSLKSIKRFSPTLDGINRPNKHITACKFSNSNSHELIGSWSSDSIYLFNINDSPIEINNTSTIPITKPSYFYSDPYRFEESNQKKFLWNKTCDCLQKHELDEAAAAANNLFHYLSNHGTRSLDTDIGHISILLIQAAIHSNRRIEREDWYEDHGSDEESAWNRYFFEFELDIMRRKLEEAEQAVEKSITWQSHWCFAIGLWIFRGGYHNIANFDRKDNLTTIEQHLTAAKELFQRNPNQNDLQISKVYLDMMELFSESLKATFIQEGLRPGLAKPVKRTFNWAELMYITLFSPEYICDYLKLSPENQHPSISESSISESSDNQTVDFTDDEEEVNINEEEEMTLYTRIMSRQIMDIYRRGSEDSDSDLDLEELAIFRDHTQPRFQIDVDSVGPRAKYSGHCNIETVKDVDFFGSNDEYIVSGSDGGYLFVWDKKTTKIVQILQADNEIVNVAKGHPMLPILAVSGIDSTTKIFTPTSRPFTTSRIHEPHNPTSYSSSSRMYDQDDIVNTNRENNRSIGADIYITRSMIAALSRISRQHRLRLLDEIADEDINDDDDDNDDSDSSNEDQMNF